MTDELEERGTLKVGEPHPAFRDALKWFNSLTWEYRVTWLSSFSSCAIEGNRLAEICAETLDRLQKGEPVSDRYFLGLCWTMRYGSVAKKKPMKKRRKL